MSGLLGFFKDLIQKDAQLRTRIAVDPAHVLPAGRPVTVAKAEEHYVRLWIAEMFLRDESRWFTSRYPLVYSVVGLNQGNEAIEIANVSGKNKLDIKQADIGRAILARYPLTPLLPFRGGTLALDCGLVSLVAGNVIESFASVVSDFAGKLATPQVSAAIGIAGSIASSVQTLLGAGNATTELYYHDAFTGAGGTGGGAPLQSGFIFLSEKVEGSYDPSEIWLENGSPRTLDDNGVPKPLKAQSYMVIEIEVAHERDDFRHIAAIRDPFDQALDAKLGGETDKGEALLLVAIRAAIKSADLTALDRKRVVAALRDGYANDGWVMPGGTGQEAAGKGSALDRALARVSADQARALPDPAEEYGF